LGHAFLYFLPSKQSTPTNYYVYSYSTLFSIIVTLKLDPEVEREIGLPLSLFFKCLYIPDLFIFILVPNIREFLDVLKLNLF